MGFRRLLLLVRVIETAIAANLVILRQFPCLFGAIDANEPIGRFVETPIPMPDAVFTDHILFGEKAKKDGLRSCPAMARKMQDAKSAPTCLKKKKARKIPGRSLIPPSPRIFRASGFKREGTLSMGTRGRPFFSRLSRRASLPGCRAPTVRAEGHEARRRLRQAPPRSEPSR